MSWIARGVCLLLTAFFLLNSNPAQAQPAGEKSKSEAETPSSASARKVPETLFELIVAGGPLNIAFISVLGMLSLVGMAVILERLVNMTATKLIPPGFVRELQELVRRNEDKQHAFQEVCDRYPSTIASILKAGLMRAGRPLPEIEKALEDAAARELSVLRSHIRPLTVLSSLAPLVGLLGTAVGMIIVFRTASQVGPGKAELLAEGIYLKLETTVAGLIVAIPSVLFAAVFNSRSEKFLRMMDVYLMETLPCFARMKQPGAERPLTQLLHSSE
jgi:biopolymer transport protein ExbB